MIREAEPGQRPRRPGDRRGARGRREGPSPGPVEVHAAVGRREPAVLPMVRPALPARPQRLSQLRPSPRHRSPSADDRRRRGASASPPVPAVARPVEVDVPTTVPVLTVPTGTTPTEDRASTTSTTSTTHDVHHRDRHDRAGTRPAGPGAAADAGAAPGPAARLRGRRRRAADVPAHADAVPGRHGSAAAGRQHQLRRHRRRRVRRLLPAEPRRLLSGSAPQGAPTAYGVETSVAEYVSRAVRYRQ